MRISKLIVENVQLSDHFKISFEVEAEVVRHEEKTITYRNYKSIDCEQFSTELNLKLQERMSGNFGERVQIYNDTVKGMVEEKAPLQSKVIKVVPNAPWFDSEYRNLRKARRRAEKKFKQTKLPADKEIFVKLRKDTTAMAFSKKREYYSRKIAECNGSKALFGCVSKLLDRKKPSALPTHDSKFELATNFNNFFKNKISKIREAFPPAQNNV